MTGESHQPTIGHFRRHYLNRTETFIYGFLSHARRFAPHVMTDVAQNLDAFPVDCTYLLSETDLGRFRREMGPDHRRFVQSFLAKIDYPNCYHRHIRQHRMQLLHAHFAGAGCEALKLKHSLGIPLVSSFYGLDASRLTRSRRWRGACRAPFSAAECILTLGNSMAGRVRALGCPAEKLSILHLGVDTDRIPFSPRRMPNKGEPVRLLFCGRLVEKKGIVDLLQAFRYLAPRWESLQLRILGDGPLRPRLESTARRWQLQDRVAFRGSLAYEAVLGEMKKSHLFCLPSTTSRDGDMEGTPTVLMEAQASGLPVVSTHHADIPEVVLDKRSGFLVPEGAPAELADTLDFLLQNPGMWESLAERGRAHIEQHYDIHRQAAELESLYADLIG